MGQVQRTLRQAIENDGLVAFVNGEKLTPARAEIVGWLGLLNDGVYIGPEEMKRARGDAGDALVSRLAFDSEGNMVKTLHPITLGLVVPAFIRALGQKIGLEFITRLQGQYPEAAVLGQIFQAQMMVETGNWGLLDAG